MSIPFPILETRKLLCQKCDCDVDFTDGCASCPKGKWKQSLCREATQLSMPPTFNQTIEPPLEITAASERPKLRLPSTAEMAKSALTSLAKWSRAGVKVTTEEILTKRLDLCHACEFWNPNSFMKTGRCMKCGCSTWAKLRMATEKCPIGKW